MVITDSYEMYGYGDTLSDIIWSRLHGNIFTFVQQTFESSKKRWCRKTLYWMINK
jgi:hypothetical protein